MDSLTHPMNLKRILLATADAHTLYEGIGFVPWLDPQDLMMAGLTNRLG